jgi:hypothetical protein
MKNNGIDGHGTSYGRRWVSMKQIISFAFLTLIWHASACLAQEGISTLIASDTQSFDYQLPEFGGDTSRSFNSRNIPGDQAGSRTASDAETEKELTGIAQELMDAVARGDKAVWDKHVADDVIYTDENWKILTKRDLVDSLAPLPKGYSGTIKVTNVRSRIHGDAAVLSWEGLEEEYVYGQRLAPVYLITDTYFKRNGRWQLVAEQITVRPQPRKPMTVNPASYKSFIGEYELTSGVTYVVTVEDGKLMGQRTGRDREELMPADENTFFRKGTVRGEKVFVRDARGRVIAMLDRRENSDLTWKRIK